MGAYNLSKIVTAKTFEKAVEIMKKEELRDYKYVIEHDEDRYEDMAYEGSWMSKIHYHREGFKNVSNSYYKSGKRLSPKQLHDVENELLDRYDDKYGPVILTQIAGTKFLAVCWVPS